MTSKSTPSRSINREDRSLRRRRRRRRAYIRSVYALPSLATLGNAICGFGAIYVAGLQPMPGGDPWTMFWAERPFIAACYLVLLAMIFDALDGRLARFARHTTDFGGQLDSLADVVSFGAAPAFIALQVLKFDGPQDMPFMLSRLIWAAGALYFACACIRLARFNVSNEHGEQHHFSFLGLPSPGAAGAVVALILVQQDLQQEAARHSSDLLAVLASVCLYVLPVMVVATGLLMVSHVRYAHVVNRYLRGRRSITRLILALGVALMLVVAHRYTLAVGMVGFALWGPIAAAYARWVVRGRPTLLPESQGTTP
jgi:CDP-diacylglycerol--serine O-phosphatidyltransferase